MYEVIANETTFHSYKYFNVILFFAVQERFLGKMFVVESFRILSGSTSVNSINSKCCSFRFELQK
jgi:hypothetical protein